MRKIIVLRGKSNTGKTTTLKRILKEYFGVEVCMPAKDAVLRFKFKNKIVVIITLGDWRELIEKYYDKIKDNYDLLIGTCRTKGETLTFYESLKGNQIEVEFIDKEENKEQEAILKINEVLNAYFERG